VADLVRTLNDLRVLQIGTGTVVYCSEFLLTDPGGPVSIPGATGFSE
jgi:hypothetical protein